MLLRQGSRVAVVSPASAAKAELVERGVERLRGFGYEPVMMPHALARGPLYYAGTAEQRVADLHEAFADSSIEGVLCTRGGWGSAELLPLLDRELICANPKVFVGYSDHTSLHTWFWNECGMRTFYAPMVAADWSKDDGVDERTWRASIEGHGAWSVGAEDGLRVLRNGSAEGRLLGGCLAILEAGLGTPWSLRLEEPTVLFLEDIGTKPYQWDRMLQHLKFAGMMKNVRGVVLGDMSANVQPTEMELLEAACLHALRDFEGPITIGLQSGHVSMRNRSVPLGAWVAMKKAEMKEVAG
ncbi:LD-carboxypeptidase [Granulicella mallensis]|uniref:Muramoyltetrapeptide carboxypeptidase n=1 Tax=Granulicella mallensis TaxID=940614 RepID=A0A7W8E9E4_9BACT|nr:LD-carboxypeptidase [Granulicella mallensis]MBB5064368.1 muramoyltetrapeptide carboxypeptidase [Granulicella mallensis]